MQSLSSGLEDGRKRWPNVETRPSRQLPFIQLLRVAERQFLRFGAHCIEQDSFERLRRRHTLRTGALGSRKPRGRLGEEETQNQQQSDEEEIEKQRGDGEDEERDRERDGLVTVLGCGLPMHVELWTHDPGPSLRAPAALVDVRDAIDYRQRPAPPQRLPAWKQVEKERGESRVRLRLMPVPETRFLEETRDQFSDSEDDSAMWADFSYSLATSASASSTSTSNKITGPIFYQRYPPNHRHHHHSSSSRNHSAASSTSTSSSSSARNRSSFQQSSSSSTTSSPRPRKKSSGKNSRRLLETPQPECSGPPPLLEAHEIQEYVETYDRGRRRDRRRDRRSGQVGTERGDSLPPLAEHLQEIEDLYDFDKLMQLMGSQDQQPPSPPSCSEEDGSWSGSDGETRGQPLGDSPASQQQRAARVKKRKKRDREWPNKCRDDSASCNWRRAKACPNSRCRTHCLQLRGGAKCPAHPLHGSGQAANGTREEEESSAGEEEEYVVRKILLRRRSTKKSNRFEYLVKWEGYPDPTWEPEENLTNCRGMLYEFNEIEDMHHDPRAKHARKPTM